MFLSALAALDLVVFASGLDSTAVSGAVDPQATYTAEQYLVVGNIIALDSEVIAATLDFAALLRYSVGQSGCSDLIGIGCFKLLRRQL